jgi:hypothetical protein
VGATPARGAPPRHWPPPAPEAGVVLTNTVTLDARWEWPFVPYFTREIPFTEAEGRTLWGSKSHRCG